VAGFLIGSLARGAHATNVIPSAAEESIQIIPRSGSSVEPEEISSTTFDNISHLKSLIQKPQIPLSKNTILKALYKYICIYLYSFVEIVKLKTKDLS